MPTHGGEGGEGPDDAPGCEVKGGRGAGRR
jgi:hypothetical protein